MTPATRVTQPGAWCLSGTSQLGCWSPSSLISNRLPPPGPAGDTSSPGALQSASSYHHGRMDRRMAHISANGTCSLFSEQFEDMIRHVPPIGPALCGYSWSHGWPTRCSHCVHVSQSLRGGCAHRSLMTSFLPYNRRDP